MHKVKYQPRKTSGKAEGFRVAGGPPTYATAPWVANVAKEAQDTEHRGHGQEKKQRVSSVFRPEPQAPEPQSLSFVFLRLGPTVTMVQNARLPTAPSLKDP
jgi:hypothetical protein